MAVVTFISDWGPRDHYAASFKGRLAALLPQLQVIDITHNVHPHDTLQASYILKSAYTHFPEGSVHYSGMMGLPPGGRPELLIVQSQGHWFVGMDNGLFSLVLGDAPRRIFAQALPVPAGPGQWPEIIVDSIVSIAGKNCVPGTAEERSSMISTFSPQPMSDPDGIRATVVYVDEFQNLVLNVTRELFEQARGERKFSIELRRVSDPIRKISNWYNEVEEGELLALFNSDGFLEIAMNRSNASGLLGINLYGTVNIRFS